MNTRYWSVAAGRTLASLACGITLSATVQAAALPSHQDPLVARLARVENVRQHYPWLLTGGQPDAKALRTLAEAGTWDVLDLRATDERRGFDERAVAGKLGLRYLSIPITAADLSDSKLTALRHHLIAHGPQHPLFVHCASGNRVGAALLPWLVLDQGVEEGLALEMAREMGLRDPQITQRAQEYIRAHQIQTSIAK